jgi:hypothetical protein
MSALSTMRSTSATNAATIRYCRPLRYAARTLMFDLARNKDSAVDQLAQYLLRSKGHFDKHTFHATSKYIGAKAKT